MRYQPLSFLNEKTIYSISFMIAILSCLTLKFNLCFPDISSSLKSLPLNGHFSFDEIHHAARDFGNRYQFLPLAVLHPKSVSDIATTISHIWQLGPGSELTVAARGHGHSLQGQAQAHRGVVVNMESLGGLKMHTYTGKHPYVDVSGGELWINVLHESLKYGLAPKSWTDYLYLSVGGTLSNAGISGQAFRYGPQISNVHQLEIVTGMSKKIVVKGPCCRYKLHHAIEHNYEPKMQNQNWNRKLSKGRSHSVHTHCETHPCEQIFKSW